MTFVSKGRSDMPLINEQIRAEKVQLIGADGANQGVVPLRQAIDSARLAGLDLVLLAEQGAEGWPLTKVMDFGKEQYAKKKQQKPQKVIQIKEIKLKPKIGQHDFLIKMQQALDFLETGKRVKFTILFKGREVVGREERGTELFGRIMSTIDEAGLTKRLLQEKDAKSPNMWSRVVYLKN